MDDSNSDQESFVEITHDDVSEMNEENILPPDPETITKIVAWLQPTEYDGKGSEYRKHLSSHLLGTGNWVLASETYKQWHDSDEHGVPGSGKSVLAASLIHRLSQEQVPVLYIFFRQIIDANHGPDAALRDWLTQALPYSVSLQMQIKNYLGEKGRQKKHQASTEARKLESLSVSDMWRHLRSALSLLPRVYIVVDAIDEMDQDNDTNEFLQSLSALSQRRPSRIKVLVTSRPLATIERAWRMESMLRLRLEETRIDSDIALYVKSRLDASSIPLEHHQAIQANVPGKANGLFLFAKLAMDAMSKKDVIIEEALRDLPLNLNVMYSRLLQEHRTKTETSLEIQVLIMQAATHSNRPLRLIEMADMIAMTHPVDIPNLKTAKGIVRSVCGPLLDVLPDETLCVVHHSLTEFLNGSTRLDSFDFPVLKGGPTHNQLAIACLSYLLSGCLAKVPDAAPENPFALRRRKPPSEEQVLPPFTKYAAANWHIHARKAMSYGIDQGEVNSMIGAFALHADFQKWVFLAELRSKAETITPLFMAVFLGLTDYVRLVISQPDVNLAEGAPICHAAEKGHVEIVEILLRNGAKPAQYDKEGYTALHLAAKNNHAIIVSLLLQAGCDVSVSTKFDRRDMDDFSRFHDRQHTSLWYACNYGHLDTVEAILPYIKTPEDINKALYWAVDSQKSDVAEMILQHPMADVNSSNGNAPLYKACSRRDLSTIKVLIAAGADPNDSAKQLSERMYAPRGAPSSLHALSAFNDMTGIPNKKDIEPDITKECFALLINAGANIDQTDNDNNTPLHIACDGAAVGALLSAGADVNRLNRSDETPMHTCQNSEALRMLVEVGKADIERTNRSGLTPLLCALDGNNFRMSTNCEKPFTLLDLGARASIIDKEGNTAIHYVIRGYNPRKRLTELTLRLCEAGADINGRNQKSEAPIHLTSIEVKGGNSLWKKEESQFQALVTAGADLKPRNDASRTPLFKWISKSILAATESELPHVDHVLKNCGAKYDASDDKGRTLLHAAMLDCRHMNSADNARLQFLINNGVDPNATDNEGNTLWHEVVPGMAMVEYEVTSGPPEIFAQLLQLGVNPQHPNKYGRTPLHVISSVYPGAVDSYKRSYSSQLGAGHAGKTTAFDMILSYYHQNVDCADQDGITPLHLACTFSEYQTSKLLKAGSNPWQANREGSNAFHISVRSKMPNIVGMMLEHLGAIPESTLLDRINSIDALGRTALYYACSSGSYEIAKMLINAGADIDSASYEASSWKGCADYECEAKSWSQSYEYSESAGGVLLADKVRSKRQADNYSVNRVEELFSLLAMRTNRGSDLIDMAIHDAAEQDADHTVDLLLRARKLLKSEEELLVTAKIRECINRKQAARDNKEPCTNCSKVHETSYRQRLRRLGDYHLLPEILAHEDLIKVQEGRLSRETILHELASIGFAAVLSQVLTLESTQILENHAWNEEQETLVKKSGGNINKGMVEPLLVSACKRNTSNMDVIRVLVETVGVNVNAQTYNATEPSSSCYSGNERDFKGECALHVLVRGEHWWQIAIALPYLLEHGANVELKDSKQMTPLSASLSRCGWLGFNKKAVELLVTHGADVNSVDNDGHSCLAKVLFDKELTELLLNHGAKVTRDVFIQVLYLGDVPLLRLLLSRGADPNVRGISRYKVFNSGNMPNDTDHAFRERTRVSHDEFYPLHYLLNRYKYGLKNTDPMIREEMAQLLLNHGANPCAKYDETTILHELICEGLTVDPILAKPMPFLDLEVRNYAGDTPLLMACHPTTGHDTSHDNAEGRTIINLLLLRGADCRARDHSGRNILHHFAQGGGMMAGKVADIEPIIVSTPELINQVNKAGKTPLHIAMEHASWGSRMADLFLSNGGDICAVDAEGNTMLHLLLKGTWKMSFEGVVNGRLLDISHRLLSMGANINARNNANETPIFSFFRHGKVEFDKPREYDLWRRTSPFDLNDILAGKKDNQARPVIEKKIPIVWEEPVYEVLTRAGVNWKNLNGEGQNLLHIVAADNDPYPRGTAARRFKALMDMGLDPGMEDRAQRTPVDIAAELGNKEVLELFSIKQN